MHLLDLILIVLILGWAVIGGFTGIVPQLSTLFSVIIGGLCAWMFYPAFSYRLESWLESPQLSVITAPLLLFIITGVLSKILINLLCKLFFSDETYKGGWFLGSIFGILKGTIIGGVLVFLLGQYGKPELMQDSIAFKRYYQASEWVVDFSKEYQVTGKISAAANYLREAVLPPQDLREESIKSAANNLYDKELASYFDENFFISISEFLSSDKTENTIINNQTKTD